MFQYFDYARGLPLLSHKPIISNYLRKAGKMRVAVVCNWGDQCGISTYSGYLIDALRPKVGELRIFAEKISSKTVDSTDGVSYCWERGQPLQQLIRELKDWQPSIVLIQHEYGIFPKPQYLLQLLHALYDTPYVVTLHSVYEHLDKTIASAAMKNIICHSESGRKCLERLGNTNKKWVIPHGCVPLNEDGPLWNTWQVPYPIVQFGFGFTYKGVDLVLDALVILKKQPKFENICYTYFCSENDKIKNIITENLKKLNRQIEELDLVNNVTIVRGYQTEQTLSNSLRTATLSIFPYKTDQKNVVYGASGAIRFAMATGIPVIASNSNMFDDMENVLPRPKNAEELAYTIDKIVSDDNYRHELIQKNKTYIKDNSWDKTAERYLGVFNTILGLERGDT